MSRGLGDVYKRQVDDQGNPVFSDTPSPGAKEVELPTENIADVPPPSNRPMEAAPKSQPEQGAQQHKTWKDQSIEEEDDEIEEEAKTVIIYDDDPVEDRADGKLLDKIKDRKPIKATKPKPRTLPSR